jgi:hypothetical protein
LALAGGACPRFAVRDHHSAKRVDMTFGAKRTSTSADKYTDLA